MPFHNILLEFVLIFAGAAVLATLFLYLRQPVILAYILLGVIAGPWGLALIEQPEHIEQLAHLGVILLLYLLGMNLQPARLVHLFSKTAVVTFLSSAIFLLVLAAISYLFGFTLVESLVAGAALMFSSTIISLKLIPTTALHHRHTGEMMTSVLLLQDVLAIVLILLLTGKQSENVLLGSLWLLGKLLLMSGLAYVFVRIVVNRLFLRFDTIREYAFLLSLGWGMLVAGLASLIGLSYEMGAFVAGVAFASSPVALVIAEDLKPLRDFFLILFFFSIGAQFNFLLSQNVLIAGLVLAVVLVLLKPVVMKKGFELIGEKPALATELGVRLGQGSEFSLMVAYSALAAGVIGQAASWLIQLVVIASFVLSTYWVVWRYPTPIASVSGNRMD